MNHKCLRYNSEGDGDKSFFIFEKTHVFDILHISYKQCIVNQVKNNVVYMHESLNYIPQLYFGIAYIFCKKFIRLGFMQFKLTFQMTVSCNHNYYFIEMRPYRWSRLFVY